MTVLVTLFCFTQSNAQVATNSGSGLAPTYATLAQAITALNAATITDPIVITLTGNETAPVGGFNITATGTSTNTITIQGSTSVITAPAQTSGILFDAIFKITGGDWITIQNFTMNERAFTPVAADRTAGTNTMTEFGVALFYATTTNGAQNCTIQNNTISLVRTYQNTFGIYSNSTHTSTATTSATATSTAGGNSGLKVYGNTISNVNLGIVVVGPTAAADANTGIDIGGSSSATGNIISNFGTTGTFSNYGNVSGTVNGILVRNSNGFNISYNSITSSNGGVTTGTLNGIQVAAASNAPTATFTNTINNNTIALTTGFSGAINGITYPSGSASATSVLNVNSNNFTAATSTVTSSGTIVLISIASTNLTTNINSNTFTNIVSNTTGSFTFISHNYAMAATGSQTINNNSIVTAFSKTGSGGTLTFVTTNSISATGATATVTNNNFSNVTVTGTTAITGIFSGDGNTGIAKNYSSNVLSNWTAGSGAIIGISLNWIGGTCNFNSNTISNITGQGTITGLSLASSGLASTVNVSSNTINNLSSTGTGGQVIGIASANTSTVININGNAINTFSTSGASSAVGGVLITGATTTNVFSNTIYGMVASGITSPLALGVSVQGGTTVNTYGNKIYNISATGAISTTSPAVVGLNITGGATVNSYNNLIGDLTAPAANLADAIRGISITSATSTTRNIYNNSIYLNASSTGTNFGTSGIFQIASITATTSALNLQNNIIVNNSTAAGTGLTVAFRKDNPVFTNNVAASNKNLFYAGVPSASNLILFDGSNSSQTMSAFQTAVAPREANSFTEASFNPATFFVSTTGTDANFLKPAAGITTQVEGGGNTIAMTSPDYNGVTRPGGTGAAFDLGAWEFEGISPAPVLTTLVAAPALTAQCTKADRAISIDVTTTSGTITGVTLNYSHNGTAQTPVTMTNSTGNTYTGTMIAPATTGNATVTWSISATNSIGLTSVFNGTSYADEPTTGITATATASVNPVCAGSPTSLSMSVTRAGSITLGTGTALTGATAQPTAFCNRWPSFRMQTIYTAAELNTSGLSAGNISAMAFNIATLGDAATNANFTVRIGTTSQNTFATTAWLTPTYTTVFPAATYTHTASGWQTINFGTPFNWDGISNLIIDIQHDGADSTNNSQTYFTATAGNTVLHSDTGGSAAATGVLSTTRLNVQFTGNAAPSPTAYSWSDGSTTVGSTNPFVVNPTAATTYTGTATVAGCPVSASTLVNVNPLPTAPTATASSQCGSAIPAASVADPNGFTTPTFKWYDAATAGTLLQTNVSPTYLISITATTTFYVSVVNPTTGCESARTAVTATVSSADVIAISGAPTASVCLGQSFALTPTQTGTNNTYALTWAASTAGSGFEASASGTMGTALTVTPTAVGTYTYALSGSEALTGCSGAASASITVVNPNAGITTSATATPNTVCSGSPTSLNMVLNSGSVNIAEGFEGATFPPTGWTIFNAGSGNNWITSTTPKSGTQAMQYSYNSSAAANTWIFSPSQQLLAGAMYTVSFWYRVGGSFFPEKLKVTAGTDATTASQTNIIWSNSNLTNTVYAQATATFVAPTSGTYYFAFNCFSAADQFNLYVDDISITGGINVGTPTYSWSDGVTTVGAGNPLVVNPTASTTYTVNATVNGCPLTASTLVNVNPLPTVPSVTASTQCGLGVPTASVADSNGFTTPTFKWYSAATAGTLLQTSTSTTYTTAINATTTFHVSVVNPTTGCESARTPVTVTVIIPDVISATATPSTICLGQSIALAAVNTASTPTQNYTYSWSSTAGSGLVTQSGATATVTPTAAGTYTYTITGIDGICTQINTVAVTVNPVPAIATASVDPTVACAGSTINLGATITGIAAGTSTVSGTGTSYTVDDGYPTFFGNYWRPDWSQMVYTAAELQTMGLMAGNITSITFNIGALPDPATVNNYSISLGSTTNDILTGFQTTGLTTVYGPVNHTVSAIGDVTINFSTPYNWDGTSNIIVDVRGTGQWANANATTQYTTTIDNTVVYAYSSPANPSFWTSNPTATTSTSRPNVKFGGQVLSNITSNYNWSWTAGSTSVLTTAAGTTILPAAPTTNYTVTATIPSTGCTTSQNFTVTANPLPLAPVATNSVQCGSQTPTASVTDPNNFSYPYINWYSAATGGTLLQSSISPTFSNTVSATTTFYVSVVNPVTNCESPRTPVLVTVNIPDAVAANASSTSLCLGQPVTLTSGNTATTPTQNYTYSWASTTDSGLENPVAGVSTSATPTATGSYVYTVTATDVATTCVITNSVTVTVNPRPVITTATANPSIACAGSTINLEATSLGIAPGVSANSGSGTSFTSSTGYPTFFGNYWYEDWSQMVYTAAELQAMGLTAGDITSLQFNINGLPDATQINNYSIRLGSTSSNTLSNFVSTGLTTVYGPATHNVPSSVGDVTINFTTPYAWDGVSNVIVDVRGTGGYGSANATTQFSTTTGTTVVYGNSGFSSNPAYYTSNPTGTTSSNRPNIKLGGQLVSNVASNYTWAWSIGSTNVLSTATGTTVVPTGATTTYTVTATNATTGCSSSQNVLVSTNVAPLAISGGVTPATTVVCIGSSATLSAVPSGGCIPYTYAWSTASGPIAGQIGSTLTVTPTATTVYTVTVTDNAGTIVSSSSTVTVNNPQPTVVGQTICANSAAFTLTASPSSASNTVNWFASPTSTSVLASTSSFTTPVLTAASTTYYAEEAQIGAQFSSAKPAPTTPESDYWTNWGIVFNATNKVKLNEVSIYATSTSSSNVTIRLLDNTGVQVAGTTNVVVNPTDGDGTTATVVPLNFTIPPGNGYRLVVSSGMTFSNQMVQETTGINYPYTNNSISIVAGAQGLTTNSSSGYYWFYDLKVSEVCTGTRVPVTATLNAPPAFAISGAATTICEADTTAPVTVITGAADYDQFTWSPATGVTSGTNGWTFNPTTTTSYTLTASQSAGTCNNTAAYVVNVNPLPTALSITPAAPSVCVDEVLALNTSGGLFSISLLSQAMDLLPSNFISSANATITNNSTYFAQGTGSVKFTVPNGSDEWLSLNENVNLVGASSATLTFSHIAATEGGYDFGYVEYSTDGGSTWTTFAPANYAGTASTYAANSRFASNSYTDWASTFTSSASTPGTGPATSLWKAETFNIPAAALTSSQFRIRFRYTTDSSVNYYGWLIDNVKIAKMQGNTTWSPPTNLYTDAAATVPYVANANAATVYVKSAQAGSQTYTATATSTFGCFRTATVPVVINALPTVVTNAVTVCAPSTVDLTAASVTTGSSADITTLTYWSDAAATVALANPSAVAVSGTYYIVASNANGCSSSITPVVVTVNPLPVLSITNPATTCFPATVDLTAAAVTAGSSSTGMTLSYFTDAAATATLATPAAVTTSGTYYIKITNNATGCNVISPVVVTIDVTSAPTGAATQSFCGTANLSQLSVTGSNIRWYSAATGGVEFPSSIWSAVGLVNGTTYYASQTVNGCQSVPRLAVTVSINATPSAPNASAQSFCGSATVADLVPSGSSLTWYDVATAGSALTSGTALASGTYYVSQTTNGCEGPRTAVAVTVNGTALPTASAQTFCGPVTVASLVASGTLINWYNVAIGGAALAGSTSLTSGTYYVTQTLNGCESPRLSVAVTVNTVAAPTGAAVQDACITETIADFVVTGDTGAVLTWYATSTSTTSITTSTPAVLNSFYYVSQTVNGCEGPRLVVIASGPCLGNEEFDMSSFSYYPNPTRDIINISYSKEITQIKVFNMLGQQVIDTKVNSTTTQVDLSRFATGTYFIEVTSDEVSKTVKVIKN
jgi:hypothetical protein